NCSDCGVITGWVIENLCSDMTPVVDGEPNIFLASLELIWRLGFMIVVVKSVRDELLRSMEEKRQLIKNYGIEYSKKDKNKAKNRQDRARNGKV
ncbi:hypothetical protein Tco_0505217, partial [Tanacetum coccineum]